MDTPQKSTNPKVRIHKYYTGDGHHRLRLQFNLDAAVMMEEEFGPRWNFTPQFAIIDGEIVLQLCRTTTPTYVSKYPGVYKTGAGAAGSHPPAACAWDDKHPVRTMILDGSHFPGQSLTVFRNSDPMWSTLTKYEPRALLPEERCIGLKLPPQLQLPNPTPGIFREPANNLQHDARPPQRDSHSVGRKVPTPMTKLRITFPDGTHVNRELTLARAVEVLALIQNG